MSAFAAFFARARGLLIVTTPVVAIATLALGLRVGAGNGVRAAVVFGTVPAVASKRLSLQVHALYEDRGVREVAVVSALTVTARRGAKSAEWHGATNDEGVAEVSFDGASLEGEGEGDLSLEVRDDAAREPLATGVAVLPAAATEQHAAAPFSDLGAARPTKRAGALAVDVFVLGQRLVPGTDSAVFVHVSDRATRDFVRGVVVDSDAEQGAAVATPHVAACTNDWAEVTVRAIGHLTALRFTAHAADGRTGEWYGALIVAPGPAVVALPLRIAAGKPFEARAVAPPVRKVTYVEVDDDAGRAFATNLALTRDDSGSAFASFQIPPLAPGRYWLITAHDARGAETLAPGTLARPFDVGAVTNVDRCIDGPALARAVAPALPRVLALDGFVAKRARLAATHTRGVTIAISAMVIAAILEAVLLIGGALQAKSRLSEAMNAMERIQREGAARNASDGGDDLDDPFFDAKNIATPAFRGVVVGVLLALLGFALLAAMVSYQAT